MSYQNFTSHPSFNNLHKRTSKHDINTNNTDYDQELGNCLENEKNNIENLNINKKNHNIFIQSFFIFIIFILIFGFYVDIFSKNNNKNKNSEHINDNVFRKLKQNDCIRNEFDNVSKYIQCMADNNHILIISDTSEHIEIKEKYSKYDIEFKHINQIFNLTDYFDFVKIIEDKTPWIFVEGTYIGNEKELERYDEYSILTEGIEYSEIKPALNENEISLLSSSNIEQDEVNMLKVRQYLRRHLPSKEVDKEMSHIKHLFQVHKNIRSTSELNQNIVSESTSDSKSE